MDIKPIKDVKADIAIRSAKALNKLIEGISETKLKAIHIFKLLCHQNKITQHHGENRAGNFKAITLNCWAVAVSDYMKPNPTMVEAIIFLCQEFTHFKWDRWQVVVSRDGDSINICRKKGKNP